MWRLRNLSVASIIATAVVLLSTDPHASTQQQQPPQTTPVFRGGADLVRLDVSVLGQGRAPVRGLSAEDFRVREDGKPQQIVAFSEVTMPAGRVRPVWARANELDVASNELGEHRLFAIVLDAGTKPTNSPRTGYFARPTNPVLIKGFREIVQAIIDRLGPDDVAAITGGTCFQPFTSDRDALENAIDSIDPLASSCPPRLFKIGDGPSRALIHDVAAYVAAAPQRRKVVIYVGPGIDLDGQWAVRGADDVRDAVLSARRGNVNIYTINTLALDDRGESARIRLGRLASLRELADHTGGTAIMDLERYPAGLDQMFTENKSYYLIGYRASGVESDGRRHDIEVTVPGQPNLMIRSRSAITRPKPSAADGTSTADQPSKDLAPDLQGLLPNLDVTFRTAVLPFARAGAAAKVGVAVITELAEPVPPGLQRVVQQMDVRVLAYDERGNVRGTTFQRATIDMAPAIDGLVRYRVLCHWELAPGPYKVRLVAQNVVTRKLASMEFDMTVPDFSVNTVSMSGVALTAMPEPAQIPSFGTLAPVLDTVPTVARVFASDTQLAADVRVYQGGTGPMGPVTMEAELLDNNGASAFHAVESLKPERFEHDRTAEYHLNLSLETLDLEPGEYLLTLQASAGSRHAPRRDIRFTVR
jgi:VWFA-related protein